MRQEIQAFGFQTFDAGNRLMVVGSVGRDALVRDLDLGIHVLLLNKKQTAPTQGAVCMWVRSIGFGI